MEEWRCHRISLEGLDRPEFVALSTSGTLVRLRTANGRETTLDLTKYKSWDLDLDTKPVQEPAGHQFESFERAPEVGEQAIPWSKDCAGKQGNVISRGFFSIKADVELYAPVLMFASQERVFPSAWEIWDQLQPRPDNVPEDVAAAQNQATVRVAPALAFSHYTEYLRRNKGWKLENQVVYHRTVELQSSWLVEYWIYYPFDDGGAGTHLHDSEHLFVEVDPLGGRVRAVYGAGHGGAAGNNRYDASNKGAAPIDLPLFAYVELGKHATAPEIDGNDGFVPGVDENFYGSRAKIWGVRDAIGNDNIGRFFETTMTARRRDADRHAAKGTVIRFGGVANGPALGPPQNQYTLRAIVDPRRSGEVCGKEKSTIACAVTSILDHPDYKSTDSIRKLWNFPGVSVRAFFSLGPRSALKTQGLEVHVDPGSLKLIVGAGYFRQDTDTADESSCVLRCQHAQGAEGSVRVQSFLTNLYGVQGGIRHFRNSGDAQSWLMLGPFVEIPLAAIGEWRFLGFLKGSPFNINVAPSLSFRSTAGMRYELRVSLGLVHFGKKFK